MPNVKLALEFASSYGSIDGGHHKMWVIDQMVRALTDCPIIKEPDFQGESEEYKQWVKEHCAGEDGPDSYEWDCGCAP